MRPICVAYNYILLFSLSNRSKRFLAKNLFFFFFFLQTSFCYAVTSCRMVYEWHQLSCLGNVDADESADKKPEVYPRLLHTIITLVERTIKDNYVFFGRS